MAVKASNNSPEHDEVLSAPILPVRTQLSHAMYTAKPVSQKAIRAYPGIYRLSLEVLTDSWGVGESLRSL